MLDFLNLQPEAFGLDISDSSLKIVKLKKKGKGLCLASFGEAKIKEGIIEGGEIIDGEALTQIIKDFLKKVKGEKLNTKYVVASLPEEKAFLQVIQLPKIKKEDLQKTVYFEAENYIPFPIDKVYLDSQIVKPFSGPVDHLDVLIAALPKSIIDSYVSSFKKAGLIIRALEIESLAISRAVIKNETSPNPTLLIDFGLLNTSFIIFSGYSLRFTTSISVCSWKITEAITQFLNINFNKAEELKLNYGFKGVSGDIKDDNKSANRLFEAASPILNNLVGQIRKYIGFYENHTTHEHLPEGNDGVRKILICGGGANLKGLDDFLSRELKLPVERANPWINILPEALREIPQLPYEKSVSYMTALGLALRGIKEE